MSTNPFESPAPEPAKRALTKELLVGAGIGLGFLLLTCGGLVAFSFIGAKYTERRVVTDPPSIQTFTSEIATLKIPEFLQPRIGVQISINNRSSETGVLYASQSLDETLAIGQFADSNRSDHRRRVDSLLIGTPLRREDLQIKQSKNVDRQIHGENARFIVSSGTGEETQTEYRRVTGHFRGRNGMAVLVLQAKSADFSDEQAQEFVESIQ